ncbi:hypothetical protein A3G67_01315 [Candidatus Roizmanbacteria bacterium RIFCSPLOWO2_12_FULL_40_12]|uniref:Penicillin-binding protein 2 n=1 Tax=Candidatus Roizmanbacteria bacterium RIFCSPLOWO2_01_FULL_40_42 TaxID=1802066 RepID=A0A1F7J536_9BACT|nr:MAG: hypothetical protein A2779_01790 [Candidatus Roizmanbacteria bacterium RIFCSPHIGHO2_01_FULL_40_98]OGK28543.1 MAG: hypothetical protein A3C31_01110 [Candidatus Roizmanbacteria bacterium RIFCSPHIGHO2_02_FULL_40_53]OGK30413.1 MAG: hypothetical protein A2W49_00845 [Candidatus Roizmanbacteria bacterium RIFCSPHIGHO2_12_41_18]OGK36556.1 MAG: hypothetical protein A3E69_03450 [Candidatus Roizmanbacteria bacterium RIFCSPHIGHO2_12_FULL_40_130]OGK50731.1 MAG: hypothetical protein A3B50_04500 [Candi
MHKLPYIEKASSDHGFKQNRKWDRRVILFLFLCTVFVGFGMIVFRLFQLTIVKGEYYRRLSDENRIKEIIIEPKRGTILDRKGAVIAESTIADYRAQAKSYPAKRSYRDPEALAHLIGYRQLADPTDIANNRCLIKLKSGEKTGKKGVEKVYDCDLHGGIGKKLVELDARGLEKKTLTVLPPEDGKITQLALDFDLQKKAHELLNPPAGGKKGAVVAMNPKTGEILALASSPSFNPQVFEDNNQELMKEYLLSSDHPLFNRATEGLYPPGSIFKIFIATGALEEKRIDENYKVLDTGEIEAGPLKFGNWYFLQYGRTDGEVDIVKGIKRSNDIFFYKVGSLLGPEKIKYWGEKFGFARKTGLPFEQAEGMIPSPFWKEEVIKDQWYLGDTYNLSIGQGFLLVTPIQVAQATSVFANGGQLCEPQLLKDTTPKCKNLKISEKTMGLLKEGMKEACATGGTGWPLFDFSVATGSAKIDVSCKTGTAESIGKHDDPHAWITTFAPSENPEIVVTVLIENGGEGSSVAGPIAKELLKTYFGGKR